MYFLKDNLKINKKKIIFVQNFYDDVSLRKIKKKGYTINNFIIFREKLIKISLEVHSKVLKMITKKFKKKTNKTKETLVNFLVGKWLFSYISNCVYFFYLLKKIKGKYPKAVLIQKKGNFLINDKHFIPQTSDRFMNYFVNEIGKYLGFKIIELNNTNLDEYFSPNYDTNTINYGSSYTLLNLMRKLLSISSIFLSKLIHRKTIYLHDYSLNTKQTIKIILKSKFKFSYLFFFENEKNKQISEREFFEDKNIFEFYRKINKKKNLQNFTMRYLEKFLPSEFKKLLKKDLKKNRIKKNILITKSISDTKNFNFKNFYLNNYHNTQLASLQHGGGYGFDKNLFNEMYERKIADYFISWGWLGKKVLSLPQNIEITNQSEVNKIKKRIGKFVLFVTWSLNRSYLCSLKNTDYYVSKSLNPSVNFVKKLSKKYKVVVKLPPFKNSWRELDNFKINKNIVVVKDEYKFLDLAKASELTIHNHLNTTALQALSLNIPTFIFCDKIFVNCKTEANRDLNKLIISKIFFYNELNLLNQIKTKNFIINEWWNSKIIQENRKKFCQKYIYSSANYQEEWLKRLL